MFTGIVRETGQIKQILKSKEGVTFRFGCGVLHRELQIGHSISVDGVCLTVTEKGRDWVEVDATPETLRCTNLGEKKEGDELNLEPAARLSDFLGGHLVQGHVDETGKILSIVEEGNSVIFRISAPEDVTRYSVFKGSITVSGISLTISKLGAGYFEVTIIPHTLEVTNMSDLEVDDVVNLEVDIVSKYVETHVQRYIATGQPVPDKLSHS